MNKAQCPECGCKKLIVVVPLAYNFEDGEFGSIACDGPEENLTLQCLTLCDKCELTAQFMAFEKAAESSAFLEKSLATLRESKKKES